VRFVDTNSFTGVGDVLTLGGEVALKAGPVLLQSEYLTADVSGNTGGDATFSGWYVGGSWAIAGRQRKYARHTGSFGALRPRSDWGAVELVARYGKLDLTDNGLSGGEESNTTIGVNWVWRHNWRLMTEYVKVDAEPNSDGIAESPSIVQARVQVGF
jgi:phosphate-selective porin OprO/OprP